MKSKPMKKIDAPTVTRTQVIAVVTLTLVALAAGVFIAALFGNFFL